METIRRFKVAALVLVLLAISLFAPVAHAQVSTTGYPTVLTTAVWVPETACSSATTGTAGAGNATDILGGSGGVRVHRSSATNASGSTNTITCVFNIPFLKPQNTAVVTIMSIDFLVSTQTTQPTSVTTPTFKSFTTPAPADPETANSATFVAQGGTITITPTTAQFAAYTPVAAGQFFTLRVNFGTPEPVINQFETYQLVIPFVQSASAASLQETPGFYVNLAQYLF